ncbi:Asp23/Gls24 family envelope stress response protein [Gudongella sp. DL1XJH-153]|uniref:Asp23/Gls24 family envelope stress response protein n=1 Tax=Gudongella sp. DL1XJH-153 TaxID=3409804 RepID=UPI003BB80E0B
MTEKDHMEYMENGSIQISNDVIATIAGTAAMEVEGVVGMSSNLAGGISELLGKKNPGKGVKVDIRDKEVSVEMHLLLEYGAKLNDVGLKVQEETKKAIENMTDLSVKTVNVHVDGISRTKNEESDSRL